MKLTSSVALTEGAGAGGVADADSVAGPAVVAQILTVATPPTVGAVAELKVPRVEVKVTVVPSAIGAPPLVKLTLTGTLGVQGAPAIGMSAGKVGAVNENC
jgi:hypothetical protein